MSVTEIIQNSAILVVVLVGFYVFARIVTRFSQAQSAHRLAPLVPLVAGRVDAKDGCLHGTYGGRKIRAYVTPDENVSDGHGDSHSRINAVVIQVLELPGRTEWFLKFQVSGALGQGPKRLWISAREDALMVRLGESGVVADVEAANACSDTYVAVRYEPFTRRLEYRDDVSPAKVPDAATFKRQLDMAVRLAAVNEQVNG